MKNDKNSLIEAIDSIAPPAKLRGRAAKAIVRFLAGSFDQNTIENVRYNLATLEGRSRVDKAVSEQVAADLVNDTAYMDRARARFATDTLRKQENVEAVASVAVKLLEHHDNESEEKSVDADEMSSDLNDDWFNAFSRASEDASSSSLREYLGKILAGEIVNPGSFARRTIRTVSELDKEIIEKFSWFLNYLWSDAIVAREQWQSGDVLNDGMLLEEAGLITGVVGLTNREFTIGSMGYSVLSGDESGLFVEGSPGTKVSLKVWLLTRAGRDLASILDDVDCLSRWKNIAGIIPKQALNRISVVPALKDQPGNYDRAPLEVFWQASQ